MKKFLLLSAMLLGGLALAEVVNLPPGYVAGYDFNGYQVRKALPPGWACPEASSTSLQVTDACYRANGRTLFDINCQTLCSVPVSR